MPQLFLLRKEKNILGSVNEQTCPKTFQWRYTGCLDDEYTAANTFTRAMTGLSDTTVDLLLPDTAT